MAALGADSPCKYHGDPEKFSFACVGALTFYGGALAFIKKGTGGVQPTPAASYNFAGIVCQKTVTTAAAQEVPIFTDGYFLVPTGAAITAADEGDLAIMNLDGTLSDNPADLVSNLDATGVVTDVAVGRIMRVTTEGMWLKLVHNICVTNVGWV